MEAFTKENLLKWAKAQSPERKFCYTDIEGCFFASFAREGMGLEKMICSGQRFHYDYKIFPFPQWAKTLDDKIIGLDYVFFIKDVLPFLKELENG